MLPWRRLYLEKMIIYMKIKMNSCFNFSTYSLLLLSIYNTFVYEKYIVLTILLNVICILCLSCSCIFVEMVLKDHAYNY